MFEFDLNTLICLKMLHSHSKYIFWLYVVIVPSIQNIKYSVIHTYAAAAAKSFQLCPTLCDPVGGSPPGFPVLGILQARILEWVTISFSSAWKWKVKVKSLSRVWLPATPWTRSLSGSSIHGIFQARVLEWGAIAFSNLIALIYNYQKRLSRRVMKASSLPREL